MISFRGIWIFFSFIFISWRLITLQYCSGFCHTLTWISHGFTCVPHPDPPSHLPPIPSLWVIPVHQPWALVSCIQPGLQVICFTLDNIYVLMLFSQVIPPLPSPIGIWIFIFSFPVWSWLCHLTHILTSKIEMIIPSKLPRFCTFFTLWHTLKIVSLPSTLRQMDEAREYYGFSQLW